MKATLILTALAATALLAGVPAHAAETWRVGSDYVIRVHDLDLDSFEGRQVLMQRVRTASHRLCREVSGESRRACRDRSEAAAVAAGGARLQQALELARGEQRPILSAQR